KYARKRSPSVMHRNRGRLRTPQPRYYTTKTLCIVGFDDLVTSFVATIATGWSDPCRVGLSPTGKPRLYAAHTIIRVEPSSTGDSRLRGALPKPALSKCSRVPLFEHLVGARKQRGRDGEAKGSSGLEVDE